MSRLWDRLRPGVDREATLLLGALMVATRFALWSRRMRKDPECDDDRRLGLSGQHDPPITSARVVVIGAQPSARQCP